MLHGIDKRQIIQRRNQIDIIHSRQQFIHRLLYVRIQVNGVDNIHIRMQSRQFLNRFADMQETFSEVLTAMASDEDILTVAYSVAFLLKFFRYLLFHSGSGRNNINRHQQSINHRISGNEYFLFIYIFLQQILFGLFSRCKVVGTDTVCHLTVHFFRPGRQHIISTQPGLYVSHRNLHIERRKRSSHRSRRAPIQYRDGSLSTLPAIPSTL